jgi:hypothetical protein
MRLSPSGFALGFALVYLVMLANEWPFLLYYPAVGEWTMRVLAPEAGPGMQWYGMLLASSVGGLVLAVAVPEQRVGPWLRRWVAPLVGLAMFVCLYLMRGYFLV